MLRRTPTGYIYWHMERCVYGWRQIGPEARMVVNDFGDLVFVGSPLDDPWREN